MESIREVMDGAWGRFRAGDLEGAERAYRRAVELAPSLAEAWYLLGAVCQVRKQPEAAESSYRRALKLAPDHPNALNNLGVILLNRHDDSEAAACFREVIRLRPEHADAHGNLGNALQALGEVEESLALYDRALAIKPDHVEARTNLGNALRNLGRVAEAITQYDEAIRIAPEHPQSRLARALALLEIGDFERGWAEHEWRFRCPGFAIPPIPRPCWDGSPLNGRRVLLYADHGFGDALQFIRYARDVHERGGRVLVACRQSLERILATSPYVERVIPEGASLTDFDLYAPVMSLPGIVGTTLETIPNEVPYLEPDPGLVDRWRAEIESVCDGRMIKVGIAWQGNPGSARDHERSFRLAELEPLARVPGVRLYSLQKGAGSEQLDAFAGRFSVGDLSSRLDDLMETAAVMRCLDLVVTLDSSVAHLAGAIGVRTWVALSIAPDWRWQHDREGSPWYPTHRLFRQATRGDWREVFGRMAGELRRLVPA